MQNIGCYPAWLRKMLLQTLLCCFVHWRHLCTNALFLPVTAGLTPVFSAQGSDHGVCFVFWDTHKRVRVCYFGSTMNALQVVPVGGGRRQHLLCPSPLPARCSISQVGSCQRDAEAITCSLEITLVSSSASVTCQTDHGDCTQLARAWSTALVNVLSGGESLLRRKSSGIYDNFPCVRVGDYDLPSSMDLRQYLDEMQEVGHWEDDADLPTIPDDEVDCHSGPTAPLIPPTPPPLLSCFPPFSLASTICLCLLVFWRLVMQHSDFALHMSQTLIMRLPLLPRFCL